jgi:hypothetical protein
MEIARQLWNRGDLKAKKLAALIAIGVDPYHPCINRSQALWAKTLVERDILNVLDKFNTGKAGRETNELNQINEVAYIVKDYLCRPSGEFERYGIPAQYHDDHVITHSYLQKRVLTKSSFKHDRIGASNALRRAMESFINDGSMREMSARECMQRYNKVIRCYVILEQNRFL